MSNLKFIISNMKFTISPMKVIISNMKLIQFYLDFNIILIYCNIIIFMETNKQHIQLQNNMLQSELIERLLKESKVISEYKID